MRLPKIQVDSITYLAPLKLYDTEKPYFSQLPCGTKLPRTNLVESDHRVEVRDVCGKEDLFKLDETGFQFVHLPTRISEWTDESVQSEYLPDISSWLKEYLQCEKVYIYNYNVCQVSLLKHIIELDWQASNQRCERSWQGRVEGSDIPSALR
jgi:hypothetical protein